MRAFLLTLIPVGLLFLCGADAPKLDPKLRFVGRWDLRQQDRAVTVNSGSHILANFDGAGVSASFDVARNQPPMPTLSWRIDDNDWQEAEVRPIVKLGEKLPAGKHSLILMVRDIDEHQPRWSPPLTGSVTFTGLEMEGGKLLDPPAPKKLQMEILGDSITEGVIVHNEEPGKTTWPWRGDGRLAYPTQTALQLDADWRQVGFGAQGLTHGGSGGTAAAPDAFNFFYKDCPRDDWQANLVVINQGTNDGGAPAATFRPLYAKFLAEVRKAYPKAIIVGLRPFNGAHADDIRAEVAARVTAGDTKTRFVDTTGWLGNGDFTDGLHPNVAGSAKAAAHLTEALRKELEAK